MFEWSREEAAGAIYSLAFESYDIQKAVGEVHAPRSPCRVAPDVPLIVRTSRMRRLYDFDPVLVIIGVSASVLSGLVGALVIGVMQLGLVH